MNEMLSRVADNLYWMSRYLERAENTARLLDVHLNLMLDSAPGAIEQQRVKRLVGSLGQEEPFGEDEDVVQKLTFDMGTPASIIAAITAARENARQVRESVSSEMWTQLNKLYLHVRGSNADSVWKAAPHDFYEQVKSGSHLFQGITDATMNHNQGWHFIQIGRYIERIFGLLNLVDEHFDETHLRFQTDISTDRYFELVASLKSVTAFEAYTKVYSPNLQPMWIVEFLLFNREFPRSLRFCVDMSLNSLYALADATTRSKNTRLYRIAGRLQSTLSYDEIADIHDLHRYIENIKQQIYLIHDTLYDTYITYPIETAL
jgi:uncharacterized alpha-E superfamily protein